ncbi:MAG: DUF1854 domain-containing protein [Verrucomicrobiales bacterium]
MSEASIFQISEKGHLELVREGQPMMVRVQHCFPWTQPKRFLSIRSLDDTEELFIEDPAALEPGSREALENAAQQQRFIFMVEQVFEVKTEHELRLWRVATHKGLRRFQTKLDDWPVMVGDGSWLLRDVAGDIYFFERLSELDEKSRLILSAYLDLEI